MTDSSVEIQKPRKRKWDVESKEGPAPDEHSLKTSRIEPQAKVKADTKAEDESKDDNSSVDGNAAASIAAARINAILKLKGIDVPIKPAEPGKKLEESSNPKIDGEFVKDIEINDVRNRYLLTKGATQTQIQRETGADVTTRGSWCPEKSKSTPDNPPLYLHISATTQENLDAAVKKVQELIEQASAPGPAANRERSLIQEKVLVPIEADRSVPLRPKLVGPQGAYVKHIQDVTNTKVTLKGKGSGFIEQNSTTESSEPLHLLVSGWEQSSIDKARQLCEDLINTAKQEYERVVYERSHLSYNRNPPMPRPFNQYSTQPPPTPPGGYGYMPPLPPGLPPTDGQTAIAPAPQGYQYPSYGGYPASTLAQWSQVPYNQYSYQYSPPSYSYGQPPLADPLTHENMAATSMKLSEKEPKQ